MNAYGRKGRERDCTQMPVAKKKKRKKNRPQMPVAKKERTDHKCLWQRRKDQTTNAGVKRKMAALIRQVNS